jgi:hypothetical protein
MLKRKVPLAVLAVGAALAGGASPAAADGFGFSGFPFTTGGAPAVGPGAGGGNAVGAGPCGTATGPNGQGTVGGSAAAVCQLGGGLAYIGPAIGQIATVIGPTIIGPAVIGNLNVSAGNGVAGA